MEKWWQTSVVYQIYPPSFADSNGDGVGDLQGIINRLDYLDQLGVEILWLSSIHPSAAATDDAITDYYAINPELGTLDDFNQLVEKASLRGMRIMIELSFDHTSTQHPWFLEAKASSQSPKYDWYVWSTQQSDRSDPFSAALWSFNEATFSYYLHTSGSAHPVLNWHNPDLRRKLYDIIQFWLNLGVSAFCLNDADEIGKKADKNCVSLSTPENHDYLHEMYEVCFSQRDILIAGKTNEANLADWLAYTRSDRRELDIILQSDHLRLDSLSSNKWQIKKLDLTDLQTVMSCWQSLPDSGNSGLFFNNSDQPRAVSRWGDDELYQQESAKMLGLCLHGLKGIPFVYQGEELGMTNYPFRTIEELSDPEAHQYYALAVQQGVTPSVVMQSLRSKTRDNARTLMQWNTDQNAGFSSKKDRLRVNDNYKTINVRQQTEDRESVWSFYQALIWLRKTEPLLTTGTYQLISEDKRHVYAYTRSSSEYKLLIICNFYAVDRPYGLPENLVFRQAELLLNNYLTEPAHLHNFVLKPYQALLYKLHSN